MEWADVPDSALWRLLRRGDLPHPTSAAFDVERWKQAAEALEEPVDRDTRLFESAIEFGSELSSLRDFMAKRVSGLSRKTALRLMAASANQQFIAAITRMERAVKARRGQTFHFEMASRALHSNGFCQELRISVQ